MKRYTFIIFVLLESLSSSIITAYAPLGSEPVKKCEIHSYECPSHYICVTYDRDNYGHCMCDRFYGFYGPTCEKLSAASYLLLVISIICIVLTCRTIYINLEFAYSLHRTGSLQQNTLCRCLFFNILLIVPTISLGIGFIVVLTSIDKQMIFHEYLRYPVYTGLIFALLLSTLSISLAWIETVEKTRRRERHSHWKYKVLLYGSSAFAILVSVISFRFSLTDMVGVFEGIAISFSYFQARHMVTQALSVMEENGDIVVYQGASDVLHTIKRTSKQMMIYSLLLSFSFLAAAFTLTLSQPKYKQQNSLPRVLQGQLCFFLALISFYKINTTLLEYLKSSAKRQLAKSPIDRSYSQGLKSFCTCLCCWLSCCKDDGGIEIHQHVELPDTGERHPDSEEGTPPGILTVVEESSEKSDDSDHGGQNISGEENVHHQHINRLNSSLKLFGLSDSAILRRLLSSLLSDPEETIPIDTSTLTPFALVTVSLGGYQSQTRVVVDAGKGKLADYVAKQESTSSGDASSDITHRLKLAAGSHAFVKCYGEPFLRCCLDSFTFGCAVGHEFLASHSQVFMAGEIEVNEEGIVTRWLNKSGLYMPPRCTMSQSGLPFKLAWLYLSEHEVSTIEPHRRDILQSSGALVNLIIDSTDDTNSTNATVCRCATCVRIRRGAADSVVNDDRGAQDIEAGEYGADEVNSLVCERRRRGGRISGSLIGGREDAVVCSWILKANADDLDSQWQLPMGPYVYMRTKEAAARIRHMMGGSLVEQSHSVVPSDMLYDSSSPSSEAPVSDLTDFHSADNRIVDGVREFPFKHFKTSSDRMKLKENSAPSAAFLGTPAASRRRDEMELFLDENSSSSDVSSVTMPSTYLPHMDDAPSLSIPRAESGGEVFVNEVDHEVDSDEVAEQVFGSASSQDSTLSTTSSTLTPPSIASASFPLAAPRLIPPMLVNGVDTATYDAVVDNLEMNGDNDDAGSLSYSSIAASTVSSQSTMSAVLAPSRDPQPSATWPSRIISHGGHHASVHASLDTVDVSEDTESNYSSITWNENSSTSGK